MKSNIEIMTESKQMYIVQKNIEQMLNKARYEELYHYAILTYDRTGRIAKERLEELKKEIEG